MTGKDILATVIDIVKITELNGKEFKIKLESIIKNLNFYKLLYGLPESTFPM